MDVTIGTFNLNNLFTRWNFRAAVPPGTQLTEGFAAACGAAGVTIRLLDPGTPPNSSSDVDGLWKAVTLVWSWAAVWPAAFVAILIFSSRRRGFDRPILLGGLHSILSLPLLATTIARGDHPSA